MRFRSTLLRVLLCVVMLLNGTTAAFASTRMAFMEAGTQPSAQHEAQPPCHAMSGSEHAAPVHDETPAVPASHADCCAPGACLCSCVSQGAAILTVHALALATFSVPAPLLAPHVSRASPALQHPIRPPIG